MYRVAFESKESLCFLIGACASLDMNSNAYTIEAEMKSFYGETAKSMFPIIHLCFELWKTWAKIAGRYLDK